MLKQAWDHIIRAWSYSRDSKPVNVWVMGHCDSCGAERFCVTRRGQDRCMECEGKVESSAPSASSSSVSSYPIYYHVRISVRGKAAARQRFHRVVQHLDHDYPIDPKRHETGGPVKLRVCTKCKGLPWRGPRLDQEMLKRLAAQVGVGVRFKVWAAPKECPGSWEEKEVNA